jgi:hypothetical protein
MKRLHITAEGQTEESFVNRTLKLHLARFNVFADVRCVLTGRKGNKLFRGGMTTYLKAKNDIERWLREERCNADVAFTTMFDYYALPDDFPGFAEAEKVQDPYQKVQTIEQAFAGDVNDHRFIPYIQLHEFETLLFADPQKFKIEYFDRPEGISALQVIADQFGNPELIDHGETTAPSKRIIDVYPDYAFNKPAVGSMIADEIGIDALRGACAHFNNWLTNLEQLG